jgi:hypothetical protein
VTLTAIGAVSLRVAALTPMHGIGGRQDLPLPFEFVLAGAATAVIASFLVLSLAWRTARPADSGRPLGKTVTGILDSAGLRWTVRGVGLTVALFMGMALLFSKDLLINPIFGFVYVWVWVGLVPISLLFGPVWRTLNPLRTVHLLGCRVFRTDPNRGIAQLPAQVGQWPAAIGLFAFVWLELVAPDRVTIPILLFWLTLYTVIMLFGSVQFGKRWFGAAEPFEAYALTMAKMSPWGRSGGGQILLRSPLAHLATLSAQPGMVVFLTVLIGSTGYDGFSNSSLWIRLTQNSVIPSVLLSTLGLLGFMVIVLGSYMAACLLAGRLTHISRRTRPVGITTQPGTHSPWLCHRPLPHAAHSGRPTRLHNLQRPAQPRLGSLRDGRLGHQCQHRELSRFDRQHPDRRHCPGPHPWRHPGPRPGPRVVSPAGGADRTGPAPGRHGRLHRRRPAIALHRVMDP